jgi:hypothetical protein
MVLAGGDDNDNTNDSSSPRRQISVYWNGYCADRNYCPPILLDRFPPRRLCDNAAAQHVAASILSSACDGSTIGGCSQEVWATRMTYSNSNDDDDANNGAAVQRKRTKRQRSSTKRKKEDAGQHLEMPPRPVLYGIWKCRQGLYCTTRPHRLLRPVTGLAKKVVGQ